MQNAIPYDPSYNTLSVATAVALPCPVEVVAVPTFTTKPTKKPLSDNAIDALRDQGYTTGLIQAIARNNDAFPVRFWVVDNSGSTRAIDGHRLKVLPNTANLLRCTRWTEIKDTALYHGGMAALLEAPTSFRVMNSYHQWPRQMDVGMNGPANVEVDLSNLNYHIRQIYPRGTTPLSDHILQIKTQIECMREELVANGQKAVVVVATDGVPTDRKGNPRLAQFKKTLQSLEGLPLWLVIRLSTDDEDVVNYYNTLDGQLEFSLDVLADYITEANEVYEHNKWLNYALPLHRMREMGFYHKLFDLLDERPFTKDEIKEFVLLLFGVDALDGIGDPQIDWRRFLDKVAVANSKEKLQWNPIKKTMTSWIDLRRLDYYYGNQFSCTC